MAKDKQDRRKRVPFGVRKLTMNIDAGTQKRLAAEGKIPRWINDSDDRIRLAQEGGYSFVETDNIDIGDKAEKQEDRRRTRKLVGKHKDGTPKYAYLMAIDKEFYDEDQREKEDINKMVDDAIRAGRPKGVEPHGVSPSLGSIYVKNVEYNP